MKTLIFVFAAALSVNSAFAAEDGYPPGLFEHSPVVPGPNDSPDSQAPPPDAGGPPEGNDAMDDYCASIASRTFHSLAEVKRAHARCDPGEGEPSLPDQ
jgi:hypothetical protein